MKQKENKGAFEAYKKAIESDPAHESALKNMIDLLSKKRRSEEIIKPYEIACDDNPGDIKIKMELAGLYLVTEDFGKAVTLANKVLRVKEISPQQRMSILFIFISSFNFNEMKSVVIGQLNEFISIYKKIPEDYHYQRNWSCSTCKYFIHQNKKFKPKKIEVLLQLIDIIESPKSEGLKKLPQLKAYISEMSQR